MDEERRTTRQPGAVHPRGSRSRLAFINTGFLDRTGDEIHTSMEAGAMVRKADMRQQPWLQAYEDNNVDVGLALRPARAGPDRQGHVGGAGPDGRHAAREDRPSAGRRELCLGAVADGGHPARDPLPPGGRAAARRRIWPSAADATLDDLLADPVGRRPAATADDVRDELENNAQGILGYVVRWVDQGIGCSKVPDIHDVALMEDRATCRISSQHIANWLHHGVVDRDQVLDTMRRMAVKVDRQNAGDPSYTPMAPGFDGPAFEAACDLVLQGPTQPSGYTEPILQRRREVHKRSGSSR